MKTILSILTVVVLFLSGSCLNDSIDPDQYKEIKLDEKSARIIESDNTFGLELFGKVRNLADKENIMISPLSVSLALAMTYNGASGTTKEAMEKTLKLTGLSDKEINAAYQFLVDELLAVDSEVLIEIANAIYYRQGFSVEQEFINVNKDYYHAEVTPLDFTNPAAKDIINAWVSDKTNQKIQKIIDQIDGDHVMFLLNAIYFKGSWKYEFDQNGTHDLPFTKSDGTVIEVPMMSREGAHLYQENSLFQAVKLPYGNEHYNMVIMVPRDAKTLDALVNELSISKWKEWMKNFENNLQVNIIMPRFKFEFENKLNQALADLGMGVAFSPGLADFTKINRGGNLNIDEVKHKTFIDVNETGTEAAAVTSVGIVLTSMPGGDEQKKNFRADQPFLFAITENDTGAILFIGEVKHPVYEE